MEMEFEKHSKEGQTPAEHVLAGSTAAAGSAPSVELSKSVSTIALLGKDVAETSSQMGGCSESQDTSRECQDVEEPAVPPGPEPPAKKFCWRAFLSFCGPGLLMSVAYLDPGNLTADIQAGTQTGFVLLWWFLLVSLGCGTAYQCVSGRIGLVTGKDLARLCGELYPRGARWTLWLLIEVAIVAVDIQETVGCAQALYILSQGKVPLWAGCIIVSATAFLLLLVERNGARWLEALFGLIIGVEAISMTVNFFMAGVPAKEVALGLFWPRMPEYAIIPAVGALGALVMPYNLFFHSAAVISRKPPVEVDPPHPHPHPVGSAQQQQAQRPRLAAVLRYLRLETVLVLALTFWVNLTVICVFATGFYDQGQEVVGLQEAGEMLGERFGQSFKYIYAVGLFAAGQVSTIALTYAGQLVMAGLLRMEVKGWARMIATRLVALVPAVTVAIVSNSENKFGKINVMLNVVQSLMLPFALIPAIHMGANRSLMGRPGAFSSRLLFNLFLCVVAVACAAINGYVLVDFMHQYLPTGTGVVVGWSFLIATYYLLVMYFAVGPNRVAALLAPRVERGAVRVRAAARMTAGWAKRVHWGDPESMLEVHC